MCISLFDLIHLYVPHKTVTYLPLAKLFSMHHHCSSGLIKFGHKNLKKICSLGLKKVTLTVRSKWELNGYLNPCTRWNFPWGFEPLTATLCSNFAPNSQEINQLLEALFRWVQPEHSGVCWLYDISLQQKVFLQSTVPLMSTYGALLCSCSNQNWALTG